MKLKYRKVNLPNPFSKRKKFLRPIISVSLKYKQKTIHYEALIDSGADFCIFPIELAHKLDMNINRARKIYFTGASGDLIVGLAGRIDLQIGTRTFKITVIFADLHNKSALLGQYGFFDELTVKFDLEKEEIEIV